MRPTPFEVRLAYFDGEGGLNLLGLLCLFVPVWPPPGRLIPRGRRVSGGGSNPEPLRTRSKVIDTNRAIDGLWRTPEA